MSIRAKALANEHYIWLDELLAFYAAEDMRKKIKFFYISAFEHGYKHGYKHGTEDTETPRALNGRFQKRI